MTEREDDGFQPAYEESGDLDQFIGIKSTESYARVLGFINQYSQQRHRAAVMDVDNGTISLPGKGFARVQGGQGIPEQLDSQLFRFILHGGEAMEATEEGAVIAYLFRKVIGDQLTQLTIATAGADVDFLFVTKKPQKSASEPNQRVGEMLLVQGSEPLLFLQPSIAKKIISSGINRSLGVAVGALNLSNVSGQIAGEQRTIREYLVEVVVPAILDGTYHDAVSLENPANSSLKRALQLRLRWMSDDFIDNVLHGMKGPSAVTADTTITDEEKTRVQDRLQRAMEIFGV